MKFYQSLLVLMLITCAFGCKQMSGVYKREDCKELTPEEIEEGNKYCCFVQGVTPNNEEYKYCMSYNEEEYQLRISNFSGIDCGTSESSIQKCSLLKLTLCFLLMVFLF